MSRTARERKMPIAALTNKQRTSVGLLILLMITCSIAVATQAQAVVSEASAGSSGNPQACPALIVSESYPLPKNSPNNSEQLERDRRFNISSETSLDSAAAPATTSQ